MQDMAASDQYEVAMEQADSLSDIYVRLDRIEHKQDEILTALYAMLKAINEQDEDDQPQYDLDGNQAPKIRNENELL